MYQSKLATCDRHMAATTRRVMGDQTSMNVSVVRIPNEEFHTCECGKKATLIVANPNGRNRGKADRS